MTDTASASTSTAVTDTDEYEHLRRKRKETQGTVELAEVVDVWVGTDEVVLRCRFDWATEPTRLGYDLNSDRGVARLERLCESNGLAFEQADHLEGSLVELQYSGQRWVPTAEAGYEQGQGSVGETFRAELELLARELAGSPAILRRGVRRVRSLSMTQTIIAVVLVKKLLIVALIAYLLL
ncbi:hypothetical protein [Haloarcula pelagica]|uniref:hypothetical protein n=1 Tax=Haloarcula pelagica TaxID=3033389 RepID=UPI0024C249E2|nr:hypothetical protein [Halomicroarcula sp. YJ-61-S]